MVADHRPVRSIAEIHHSRRFGVRIQQFLWIPGSGDEDEFTLADLGYPVKLGEGTRAATERLRDMLAKAGG